MLCHTLAYVLWAFGTSLSGRSRMNVHFCSAPNSINRSIDRLCVSPLPSTIIITITMIII